MPEDVARALGAGEGSIVIAGKECRIRPLGATELAEVERECVKQYKREYLETLKANLDLLPATEDPVEYYQRRFDEVLKWDIDNLPPKYAYAEKKIKLTPALKTRVDEILALQEDEQAEKLKRTDATYRIYVRALLDGKMLSEDEYKKLSGATSVPKARIAYSQWWISGNIAGSITFVWAAFRQDGVTKEEIARFIMTPGGQAAIIEIVNDIERLSAPQANFG